MSLPTSNTSVSNLFFQRSKVAVVRTTTTERSSTASSGSCVRGHPGEICPSDTETGRLFTTASGAGQKMARLSRSCGICKGSSMPKAVLTGASSTWTAPSFKPLGPLRVGRTTVKRGSNRARRGNRTGARLRPGRLLNQDPLAHRSARPSARSSPVGRPAPRGGLLHRPDERSIDPSAPRTAAEASGRRCWRSGLRCRLDPALARGKGHRVSDSGPQRPPRRTWTPADLRRSEIP